MAKEKMTKTRENILGVDIGGSKINFILWNGQNILEQKVIAKPTLAKLKEGVGYFAVKKIAMALPGVIDKNGQVLFSPNLQWLVGLNLKKVFKDKEILVDNDAKCFLRAESILGKAGNYQSVLAVVFGTGIGGAFKINQNSKFKRQKLKAKIEKLEEEGIYRGASGSAGEVGHMILDFKNKQTWEKLYQKAKGDKAKSQQIVAIGLANLINLFNPEVVILGGGGAHLPKRELLEKYVVSPQAKKTKVILSDLKENAVVMGAVLLFDCYPKK